MLSVCAYPTRSKDTESFAFYPSSGVDLARVCTYIALPSDTNQVLGRVTTRLLELEIVTTPLISSRTHWVYGGQERMLVDSHNPGPNVVLCRKGTRSMLDAGEFPDREDLECSEMVGFGAAKLQDTPDSVTRRLCRPKGMGLY